jgi:hypothetical protein
MLRQGYAHPGTRKRDFPAWRFVGGSLLLVIVGAVVAHQNTIEVPTPDPYANHDRKTQEATTFMEESACAPGQKNKGSGSEIGK